MHIPIHLRLLVVTSLMAVPIYLSAFVGEASAGSYVGQGMPCVGGDTHCTLLLTEQAAFRLKKNMVGNFSKKAIRPDPSVWMRTLSSAGGAYNAKIFGQATLIGFGKEVRPGLTLGVAAGILGTRISASQENVKTRTNDIYLYSRFSDQQVFINTAIAEGILKTDTVRHTQPSGLVASGSGRGSFVGVAVKSGYRFTRDSFFLYPYLGAGYLHIHRNAYSEVGAGSNDLNYGDANYGIGSFRAGTRIGIIQHKEKGFTLMQWVEIGGIAFSGNRRNILKVTLDTVQQVIPDTGAPSTAGTINVGLTAKASNLLAQLIYRGQYSRHAHLNTGELQVFYRW